MASFTSAFSIRSLAAAASLFDGVPRLSGSSFPPADALSDLFLLLGPFAFLGSLGIPEGFSEGVFLLKMPGSYKLSSPGTRFSKLLLRVLDFSGSKTGAASAIASGSSGASACPAIMFARLNREYADGLSVRSFCPAMAFNARAIMDFSCGVPGIALSLRSVCSTVWEVGFV